MKKVFRNEGGIMIDSEPITGDVYLYSKAIYQST